jgi:S-formylglutathione hydrolase FrmB
MSLPTVQKLKFIIYAFTAYFILEVHPIFAQTAVAPWFVAGDQETTLPIPPVGGQYLHTTYHSNLLNQNIGFVIYLPPGYFTQTTKEFPLIMDLHGAETAYFDYSVWTGHYYTDAMQNGTLPEAIVVFPNGLCGPWNDTLQGGAYWLDYFDPGVGYPGKVETTIITELLPYLEVAYRVGTKNENKAIVGHSMGGYGAVRYAILSQKFGSCTSLDGALRKKENVSISDTYMTANYNNMDTARANSIHTIYLNNKTDAKNIPFYISTSEGSRWPDISWASDAQALAEMMTADGVKNTYEFIPGIDHDHSAFWDLRKTQIFSFIRSYLVLPTGKNQ